MSDLYVDLVERAVAGRLFEIDERARRRARFWQRLRHPYLTRNGVTFTFPPNVHTMIGPARLQNLRHLVETALRDRIPGHFIETGVWRGGACILMRAILKAQAITDRKVYCADSFAGLPRSDGRYRQDRHDRLYKFSELAVSVDEVRKNFDVYGLLDEQVVFLVGRFRDTLPTLTDERFAVIRLDGDMYESTMDALTHLYPRLSPGGFAIIDDYGPIQGCRTAVHDYLNAHKLSPEIVPVDVACVWWRKAP
jgi:O-methyltransferase